MLPSFDAPKPNVLTAMNRGTDLSAIDATEELPTLYFPIVADPTLGVGFNVYPMVNPADGKYTGLALSLRVGAQLDFPLSEDYTLETKLSANVQDGLGVRMVRGEDPSFVTSLSGTPAEIANTVQFGMKFSIVPTDTEPLSKLLQARRARRCSLRDRIGKPRHRRRKPRCPKPVRRGGPQERPARTEGRRRRWLHRDAAAGGGHPVHLQSRRRPFQSRRALFRRVVVASDSPTRAHRARADQHRLPQFRARSRRWRVSTDHRERFRREARAARRGRRRRRCPCHIQDQR